MTVPPEDPRIEAVAARLREAVQERAAAYGPLPAWEAIWKRPRKPKTDREKKQELRKQRKAAGIRRFYAGQSRRPGPGPGRTASAVPPRAAMPAPCPGCGTPPPGCGDDAARA